MEIFVSVELKSGGWKNIFESLDQFNNYSSCYWEKITEWKNSFLNGLAVYGGLKIFFYRKRKWFQIGVWKLFSERPSIRFAEAKWNGFYEKTEAMYVEPVYTVRGRGGISKQFSAYCWGLCSSHSNHHSIIFTFSTVVLRIFSIREIY